MSSIQRRIAAVSDSAAHLVAQLRELDELREQVRKALQLRAPRRKKRNRKITTPRVFSKRPAKSQEPARGRNGPLESNSVGLPTDGAG